MKLIQLKVTNFRCYREETILCLDDLTILVGKNDAGKSSILDALDIFFGGKPDTDDLNVLARKRDEKMRIICVFEDFPEKVIIDTNTETTFKQEYLLNENGKLEIIKEYDFTSSRIGPKVFANAKHPTAKEYDKLLSMKIDNLRNMAKSKLEKDHDNNIIDKNKKKIDQRKSSDLRQAIWESVDEKDLNLENIEIELNKEDGKEIWKQIEAYMPVFALFKSDRQSTDQDEEAQNPMKSAVKEAVKAVQQQLDEIADKVKEDVQRIIDLTMTKIKEMSPNLASQLNPSIETKGGETLFTIKLTGDQDIPVNKRGSGTRRLILLNFFRAQAEKKSEDRNSNVIYAVEEPETSQHPDNQIMLAKAFEELVERSDCQVFLSTHTPMLTRRFNLDSLRFVDDEGTQKIGDSPKIYKVADENTMNLIAESLGVLPNHNVKVFFGVEGRNDIDFLQAISKLLHENESDIPNLYDAVESGNLIFVPIGGCGNLDLWVSRLYELGVPEFYLIDSDNEEDGNHKLQGVIDNLRKINSKVWITKKNELENYIPYGALIEKYPKYTGEGKPSEDVPALLAKAYSRSERKIKSELALNICEIITPNFIPEIDEEVRMWLRDIGEALNS